MAFKPNICRTGRLLRAALALLLLLAGLLAPDLPPAFRLTLFVASAFVFFEALRGWCLLRACGIKTRL